MSEVAIPLLRLAIDSVTGNRDDLGVQVEIKSDEPAPDPAPAPATAPAPAQATLASAIATVLNLCPKKLGNAVPEARDQAEQARHVTRRHLPLHEEHLLAAEAQARAQAPTTTANNPRPQAATPQDHTPQGAPVGPPDSAADVKHARGAADETAAGGDARNGGEWREVPLLVVGDFSRDVVDRRLLASARGLACDIQVADADWHGWFSADEHAQMTQSHIAQLGRFFSACANGNADWPVLERILLSIPGIADRDSWWYNFCLALNATYSNQEVAEQRREKLGHAINQLSVGALCRRTASLRALVEHLLSLHNESRANADDAKRGHNTLATRINSMNMQLRAAASANATLQSEVKRLTDVIATRATENAESMRAANADLLKVRTELTGSREVNSQATAALQNEINRLTGLITSKGVETTAALDALNAQLVQVRQELAATQKAARDATAALVGAQALNATLQMQLKDAKRESAAQLLTMNTRLAAAERGGADQVSKLNSLNAALQDQLTGAKRDSVVHSEMVSGLQTQLDDAKAQNGTQWDMMNKLNVALTKQLTDAKQDGDAQMLEMRQAVGRMSVKIDSQDSIIAKMNREMVEQSATIARLNTELALERTAATQAQLEISKLSAEKELLAKELADAKAQLAAAAAASMAKPHAKSDEAAPKKAPAASADGAAASDDEYVITDASGKDH
jgi:chromosome segregation ATPase